MNSEQVAEKNRLVVAVEVEEMIDQQWISTALLSCMQHGKHIYLSTNGVLLVA